MMADCVVTPYRKDDWGYGVIWVDGKYQKHHRMVFEQHHGYLPEVVMHKCDNPGCINLEHLLPGTHGLNCLDRKEKGRNGRLDGERNGRAKVTDKQAMEIRDLVKSKLFPQRVIASWYGIDQTAVSAIGRGKTFRGATSNSRYDS